MSSSPEEDAIFRWLGGIVKVALKLVLIYLIVMTTIFMLMVVGGVLYRDLKNDTLSRNQHPKLGVHPQEWTDPARP
jgi:hypothetical protein